MKHTTEKRITSLDQLNEGDKIRLVHNKTETGINYTVSKIDRKNEQITLVHEKTARNNFGNYMEEKSTLHIGAGKNDFIFSDAITIWRIEEQSNTSEQKPEAPTNSFSKEAPDEKHDQHQPFEPRLATNPFTGLVTKMPVLVIDDPAVLPVNFEGKLRLELHDAWKESLKDGYTDNTALYPITYQGRVFGVTAIDDLRTVIVRVTVGPDQPVFQAIHKYPDGKPQDTNLAISACVIKLTAALSYWSVMTTSIALCNEDIITMFKGRNLSEVLDNIDDTGKAIVKSGLAEYFSFMDTSSDEEDDDAEDEKDDETWLNDDAEDTGMTAKNTSPSGFDEALPRARPWWWTANEGLI